MPKQIFLNDATILELYEGEFEDENKEKKPYYQLRAYQFGHQSDFLTVIKLTEKQLETVKPLVHKKVNLLLEQKAFNGRISYHFSKVA
jgi:hypothetical protein